MLQSFGACIHICLLFYMVIFEANFTYRLPLYTAVLRNVVQLKSIEAYATIPKGMMGCGCSLLHCQVHEFSARWKAVL